MLVKQTSMDAQPPTLLQRAAAWGVHLFTASGAVWGLLSILAIQQHQYKLLFLWVALAMFADGFDGFLARWANTKAYAPEIDGSLLDNIIDYLNYVVVAALLVIEAHLVPEPFVLPIAALMVLTSAFQFSQVDAKTDETQEYFFKGFPSFWNVMALYLLVLDLGTWFNLAVLVGCAVLVFVPIKYIYPSRTKFLHSWNLAVALLWGASGAVMMVLYPNIPTWLTWMNLSLVGIYFLLSVASTIRKPVA